MHFPPKPARQIIPAHPQRNRAISLISSHLTIPVHDLPIARCFYGEVFGLSGGRSTEYRIDFDFFGHQLVIYQHSQTDSQRYADSSPVNGHDVSAPYFDVVFAQDDWHALAEHLKQRGTHFVIEPYIRLKGQVGEQTTLFPFDPCGNAPEFKSFRDLGQSFAK